MSYRPLALLAILLVGFGGCQQLSDDRGQANDCQYSSRVVAVELSERRWPQATDHIEDVRRWRPSTRILRLDRDGATKRREAAMEGHPPRKGKDRDEVPPAISTEGGARAHIRYIDPADNRGAGASMGNQLEPYCDGVRFRFRIR